MITRFRIRKAGIIIFFFLTSISGLLNLDMNSAYAGDISIEIGRGNGAKPKGEFIDGLEKIEGPFPYHNARFSINYYFDSGLVVGREQFGSYFEIEDESEASYLYVRINSFTLGWRFEDFYGLIVEAGIPEAGKIATSKNAIDFFNSSSEDSQNVSAHWVGLKFDFGLNGKDDRGFGAMFNLRQVSMSTDDLFDSGKSFDASGLYFGGGLRYRF